MNCPDCRAAAARIHHGFASGCQGCAARAASRSPHFARVFKAQKLDSEYRALLEQFGLQHDEVKAAAEADQLGKVAG